MSKKISAMPVATSLADVDSFTILKDGAADTDKNQQITKANALLGVTRDPPAAGNKLRDQSSWVAAGNSATKDVGTTSTTVAAGDAPANAVTAHNSAFAHANLPTANEKAGLTASASPGAGNAYVTTSAMTSAISAAGHAAVTVLDTATVDLSLTGQQISGDVIRQMSITADASGLKLQGDATSPGTSKVYGTDASGVKGWQAQTSGGMTEVADDPSPTLGGNLALDGNRIMVTDSANNFHGAFGYSPTVGAMFLSENTPGSLVEKNAGIAFQTGLVSLHGTIAQVKSLVGVGNREVHCDPDGNLYPVDPAKPAWDVEDQSNDKIVADAPTGGGVGVWKKLTNLFILTEQAITAGDPIGATTRAYINNIGATSGGIEFGCGSGESAPTTPGALVPIAPYQQGYVTASLAVEALLDWPQGTKVMAWVRGMSEVGTDFSPWVDGLTNPHYLTFAAGAVAGGSDATHIQGFEVTTTDPIEGQILVYREAQSKYVLEAKPASGSTPSAADVSFTPGGTVQGTNCQTAIAEVAAEACQLTDSRLTDARTPTAHASTHHGGSDPITPVGIGAEPAANFTTASRSVNDDATVAAMVNTLGGATSTGTGGLVREGSPVFTGNPTAPTQAQGDNDTSIATTAFVNAEIAADAAPIGHVGSGGTAHANAVAAGAAGFMTGADKTLVNNLGASQTAKTFFAAPNASAGVPSFRAIVASDVPTLNQDTTGSSGTITSTLPITKGGTGQITQQAAMNALAGAVTNATFLRGNATNVLMSAIQAADVPTLNQNTTGTASNVTGIVAIVNGGTGAATDSQARTNLGLGTAAVMAGPSSAIVGVTDTQTLTNKTITGTRETVFTITDGASVDINPANGGIQVWILGAARSPTASNFLAGHSMTLMIGGNFDVTWPSVTWVNGTAPVKQASGYAVATLWKVSTTLYGSYTGTVA